MIETNNIPNIAREIVEDSLKPWIGIVNQTPPMFSAIKVDGKRLYQLARAGLRVERKERTVTIHGIKILKYDYPQLIIEVECEKGTYIRSLAHDIGESLGCGGHITDLVRLLCGGFSSENSITLEQLEDASGSLEGWKQHLYPLDKVLTGLRSITLGTQAEKQLRHGQAIVIDQLFTEFEPEETRKAYNSQGIFTALVKYDRGTNTWRPIKVFPLNP